MRLQALSRLVKIHNELIKEGPPLRSLQQRQASVQRKLCHLERDLCPNTESSLWNASEQFSQKKM